MPDVLPLSSVKAHLSEIVDRVELEQERIVLTRNGKAAAVLISTDDLEGLEETLAILSDPTLREQIREGEAAVAADDTATLEELQTDLQARRASHRAA
jgi:prevent-host-death family protein